MITAIFCSLRPNFDNCGPSRDFDDYKSIGACAITSSIAVCPVESGFAIASSKRIAAIATMPPPERKCAPIFKRGVGRQWEHCLGAVRELEADPHRKIVIRTCAVFRQRGDFDMRHGSRDLAQ